MTTSISTYLKQQANFENYRRKFLTQCTSYTPIPFMNQEVTNNTFTGVNVTATISPYVANAGANASLLFLEQA